MQINTNTNLAEKENLKKIEDSFGKFFRIIFLIGMVIFPWLVLPGSSKSFEILREVFLFSFTGIIAIILFIYSLKKREFEWRRTKLNWILAVWVVILGLLFLYSNEHKLAWEGYPASLTGGFAEYLAFIFLYLLSTQLFSAESWGKVLQYFLISVASVLAFFILAAVYFHNNNILTIDFARTPSLVAASAGVAALALWWALKKTEAAKKSHMFILVLSLFFVSSILDFYISWWMWVFGASLILIFDFIPRIETHRKEKEERQLSVNSVNKESNGLMSVLFHGDAKYLLLIILFALSRSLSPVFLSGRKIEFMPFFAYMVRYPILGQKVLFYLLFNLIVFCFGVYYFWKLKKERSSIMLVLSGIVSISAGLIFYYSESTILFLLNWILIVYGGLTFLRKPLEKDYLYYIKPGSQGKKVFVILGMAFSVVILGLIILRVTSLFL